MGIYAVLLRLLPRARRERFGEDMTLVFAESMAKTYRDSGPVGAGLLLMKETTGMVRFSARDRLGAWRSRLWSRKSSPNGGGQWATEIRWALRGIRARG